MTNLRILHLSNLLIDGKGSDAKRLVRHLKKWADTMHAEKKVDYEKQIDYLIVCGNITRDGKDASFKTAAVALRALADFLLKPITSDANLIRLLVVPGVKDTPLTENKNTDFSSFQRFYNELFKNEINQERVEAFDPDTVIVRHFKDLTLVGACYWTDQRVVAPKKRMLRRFGEAIERIKEYQEGAQEKWVNYVRLTPTLLATAETPLLSPGVYAEMNSQIAELRRILEGQIETTLHLFGEGATPLLAPQPFAFNYLSLGTGPRRVTGPGGKERFWPFQMNLIEINYDACLNDTPCRQILRGPRLDPYAPEAPENQVPFLKHTTYRLNGDKDSWHADTHEDGLLDRFCKMRKPDKSSGSVFAETLKEVSEEVRRGSIVVRGITGSGKLDLFYELEQEESFRQLGGDYWVAGLKLSTYKDLERNLVIPLQEKFKEYEGEKKPGMVIIYDYVYSQSDNQEKEYIREVFQALLRNSNDYERVIYFIGEADYRQGYDPFPHSGPVPPELGELRASTGWVVLHPLKADVMDRMISDYSCCAPISSDYIKSLTGHYAGFSKTILKNLKRDFEERPGTTLINRKVIVKMLEKVLQDKKVKDLSNHIVGRIEHGAGGKIISGFIQSDLRMRIDRFDSDWYMLLEDLQKNPITLDLNTIRNQYPDEKYNTAVLTDMKELIEFGLFADETKNLFRLRVVGPYLIAVTSPRPTSEPTQEHETRKNQETTETATIEPAREEQPRNEPYEPKDVGSIAELLCATGIAAFESRTRLCNLLAVDTDDIPFLNREGESNFAHLLVGWLNKRVAVESLDLLFVTLEENLEGYKNEAAVELREKLTRYRKKKGLGPG